MQRLRQLTAQIYALTAPRYEQAIGPVMLPLARDLVRITPLPARATIVDIGTGTGFVLRAAASPRHHTIGIDLSLPMLRIAASLRAARQWPNVSLLQADAHRLDVLPVNACDVVLASFGLSESEPFKTLRAIRRVLRPGGQISIQEWGPCDRDDDPREIVDHTLAEFALPAQDGLRAELQALLADPSPWQQHLQSAEDYTEALHESGFHRAETREYRPVTFRLTVPAFLTYALAWAPRALEVDALEPAARQAFLRRLTRRLEALADADQILEWAPLILRATAQRAF